jgi:hypothetical protein
MTPTGLRRSVATVTGQLGLPVLLSRVLGGMVRDLERDDDPLVTASLAVWANVLRPLADAGGSTCERELVEPARISKRLMVAAVTGAAGRGWLTTGPSPGRGAGRAVDLADGGRASDARWRARLERFDADHRDGPLAAAVADLVARFPLEHPWQPASYGTADPSAVGGSFVRGAPADGIPPHGQDWRPVRRVGGASSVVGVPLPALLSQALVAFTIDYEAAPMWPLASTTLVVQHLGAKAIPLADVPGDHGIAGNGKSLLERHGVAVVAGGAGRAAARTVRLTALGERIRARHTPTIAAVEAAWRDRYGVAAVDHLRTALDAEPAAGDESLPDHHVAPLHHG